MTRIFIIVILSILVSCKSKSNKPNKVLHDNNNFALSVFFTQMAPEYKALAYQAYNIAQLRLYNWLQKGANDSLAVVVDIDETILDNSPYQGAEVLDTINFPEFWNSWCLLAEAKPVPGAQAFLRFADSMGVAVFYISNRSEDVKEATMKNLKKFNFPQVDDTHVLLEKNSSKKEERRQSIRAKGYEIAILIGDNISDFSEFFEVKDNEKRNILVQETAKEFGDRFIVLPNPMYGSWLANLGLYKKGINQDSLIRSYLQGM